jgi:anti-sigma factor RsiW
MSLECAHHQERFSALIDKQLARSDQGALEEHLCNCQDCSVKFARHKAVNHRLSKYFATSAAPVPDLWLELKDRLPRPCELILSELSAFLDGELTSAAQEGVRVHLKDCNDCLKQFRSLNTTNRLIVKALELPPRTRLDFWPALKAQLNENCTLIASELSAFVDQELPIKRHRDITVHILECPTCSETVRRFSGVGELITKGYVPNVPDQLNLIPGITGQLKVVPFQSKEQAKAKANRPRLFALAIAVGLLICTLLSIAVIMFGEAPLSSSEDVLIQADFGRAFDSAEAIVYAQ